MAECSLILGMFEPSTMLKDKNNCDMQMNTFKKIQNQPLNECIA